MLACRNGCGVLAASGKHLCSSAQAPNAVCILPVPPLRCGFAPVETRSIRLPAPLQRSQHT